MSADLWVITSYFNPCRYRTRRKNFDLFMAGMEAVGANVLVVELAFGEEEFELPAGKGVLQLRSDAVLWHKERLLNLAAAALPDECRKVAWLDCDVLFDDPRWLERTSAALDRHMIVQPYNSCTWLAPGEREFAAGGGTYESFAHCFARAPYFAQTTTYVRHGHTGFGWAARRELFERYGLYDRCLSGGSDHLMAHAFAGGMIHSPCVRAMIGEQTPYATHFWTWAAPVRDLVEGRIGFVPGTVLHLWHGDLVNRSYGKLDSQLQALGFDPDRHLRTGEGGLLEWSEEAPQPLRDWARDNFAQRREDGDREGQQLS